MGFFFLASRFLIFIKYKSTEEKPMLCEVLLIYTHKDGMSKLACIKDLHNK